MRGKWEMSSSNLSMISLSVWCTTPKAVAGAEVSANQHWLPASSLISPVVVAWFSASCSHRGGVETLVVKSRALRGRVPLERNAERLLAVILATRE